MLWFTLLFSARLLIAPVLVAIIFRLVAGPAFASVLRGVKWVFASKTNAHVFFGRVTLLASLSAYPTYLYGQAVLALVAGLPWVIFLSIFFITSLGIEMVVRQVGDYGHIKDREIGVKSWM
jgi:ABC-type microcin C transport system permease subunit YejB